MPESSPINSYLNPECWDGRMVGQPTLVALDASGVLVTWLQGLTR